MDVFVGNLPESIAVTELERLLLPFDRQAAIRLHQQSYKDGCAVSYAVCTFSSERLARKAIKKLDGYVLFGRRLSVREFLYRSYSNERRALGWRTQPWAGPERRGCERRGGTAAAAEADIFAEVVEAEQIDEGHIVIEAYHNFATKNR